MEKFSFGFWVILTFIFIPEPSFAQEDPCNCLTSFKSMVEVYEENYSLFSFKVKENNKSVYEAFTAVRMEEASQVTDLADCETVMEKWLGFFRDNHNWIRYSGPREKVFEDYPLDLEEFKSKFLESEFQNPVLGIWQSGLYEVAIIPIGELDFIGVITNSSNELWKKGDIKFKLKQSINSNGSFISEFYLADHSKVKKNTTLVENQILEFEGLSNWVKVWPEKFNEQSKDRIDFAKHHFKIIDGRIPYFRFPNFWDEYLSWTDSVVKANHELLIQSDFMIIDVRDNGGGNDVVYYPLLPYILTGSYQVGNPGYYLSDYNKKIILEWAGVDLDQLEEEDEDFQETINKILETKNDLFFFGEKDYVEIIPDTIYSGPRKVAVLTDKNTVSSGETFVYRVNQSEKVVVYGQNTSGTVDGFNVINYETPCFVFTFPSTVRAFDVGESPIDPYGIAPDVYLDEKENVLEFAIKHMRILVDKKY